MASNGQLPASALAPIHRGRLATEPAAAWNAMNVEARSRGLELYPTGSLSSYRDIAGQQELYRRYLNGTGALAARPGTSNHGLGRAVDIPFQSMRSMIDRIGRNYGWAAGPGTWSDAPSEWWHCVYRSGIWRGRDPGPTGQAPAPAPPAEVRRALAIGIMPDGRFEVFRQQDDTITHRWHAREGGWTKGWSNL